MTPSTDGNTTVADAARATATGETGSSTAHAATATAKSALRNGHTPVSAGIIAVTVAVVAFNPAVAARAGWFAPLNWPSMFSAGLTWPRWQVVMAGAVPSCLRMLRHANHPVNPDSRGCDVRLEPTL